MRASLNRRTFLKSILAPVAASTVGLKLTPKFISKSTVELVRDDYETYMMFMSRLLIDNPRQFAVITNIGIS